MLCKELDDASLPRWEVCYRPAVSAFLPRISLAKCDAGKLCTWAILVILIFSTTIQGRESPLSIVDALEICHFVTRPAMRTEGTRTFGLQTLSPDLQNLT